jgi:predicted transcriptional regulator
MTERKRGHFLHRSSIDIVRDLLATAKSGIRKTRLMTAVDISHQMMNKYLHSLKGRGLIQEELHTDGARIFKTTDKGLEFLDIYHDACKIAGYNPVGGPNSPSLPGFQEATENTRTSGREFERSFDW